MIVEMVIIKDLHNVEVTKDPRYQSGRLLVGKFEDWIHTDHSVYHRYGFLCYLARK